MEREVLWRMAPHIIWPLRFVLPHADGLRPAWLLRLGLFLYDHLGGRKLLPATRTLDMTRDPAGKPLKPQFSKAFEYSDCWVERCAAGRAERPGRRRSRRRSSAPAPRWSSARRDGETGWSASRIAGAARSRQVQGAAARQRRRSVGRPGARRRGRPERRAQCPAGQGQPHRRAAEVRRSRAYFFQNADGRIIFAIPYEHDFTLIGTTDQDYEGDPADAAISEAEIDYLCAAASEYFAEPVRRERHRLDLFGRAPALRRRRLQGAGGDARLCAEGRRREGGAPLRQHLRRQDHDLPAPCRGRAGEDRGAARRQGQAVDGRRRAARRRFPVDRLRRGGRTPEGRLPLSRAELARRLVRLYGTRRACCSAWRKSEADLGQRFGADLTRRGPLPDGARMGGDRRGRACGGAPSAACSSPRGGGRAR